MRKFFFTAVLCLSAGCVFGQMKIVNQALNESKIEKPDFGKARGLIKEAIENEESKANPKTWFTAGVIENKVFEGERNKQYINQQPDENVMYAALMDSYNYLLKSVALDTIPNEKGKVKPKYLKEIKGILKANQNSYINGGSYYFDKKEYSKAYNFFKTYLQIPVFGFMASEKIPMDSTYSQIKFYAALAATQTDDKKLAINLLEDIKNGGFNENEVYQYLVFEYGEVKDTVNLVKTLEEGATRFPKNPLFIQNLINLYIFTNRSEQAIAYLDKAIEADPKNPQYWNVKGGLYENMNNDDLAIQNYEKALELDSDYAEALGNLGRIYFNRAIKLNDEASNIKNNAEYVKYRNEVVLPEFKKSLPFFEKAHNLKPDVKQYMVALRGIYYNLNDEAKLKSIEEQMNGGN